MPGISSRMISAFAAVLIAGSAMATDLTAPFEKIGEMQVDLGGDTMMLVVARNTEKGSAYAEQKMIMGSFLTVNVVGRAVTDEGKPGRPMLQMTFQKQGGALNLLSAEVFDDQGFDAPMVMDPDFGEKGPVTVSFENDHLEATVEGAFLRLTGYAKGQPVPAEGAKPVPAAIKVSVDVPPME